MESMGFQHLFSRSETFVSFLGYTETDVSLNIKFARVILMALENAKHFSLNLFNIQPQGNTDLQQVWLVM